jgi:hypothetical protein
MYSPNITQALAEHVIHYELNWTFDRIVYMSFSGTYGSLLKWSLREIMCHFWYIGLIFIKRFETLRWSTFYTICESHQHYRNEKLRRTTTLQRSGESEVDTKVINPNTLIDNVETHDRMDSHRKNKSHDDTHVKYAEASLNY